MKRSLERNIYSKFSTISSLFKKRQSEEDFTETKDISPEETELKYLKSIESKIGLGVSSGGIFDFLLNGLPKLVSGLVSMFSEGAIGAGLAGLAGKFKWFKIPKISKIGGSVLSKVKNPKIAVPLVLGSIAVAGGSYLLNKEEKPVTMEGRAIGGDVKKGKSYVVGEKGPEILTPKENGVIIPNHKINKKEISNTLDFTRIKLALSENNKNLKNTMIGIWATFNKPFSKNLKKFSNTISDNVSEFKKDVSEGISETFVKFKNYILKMLPSWIKEAPKRIGNAINNGYNKLKKWVSDASKVLTGEPIPVKEEKIDNKPMTVENIIKTESPKIDVISNNYEYKPNISQPNFDVNVPQYNTNILKFPGIDTAPRRERGDYNVKNTKIYKIHQNEMVIPKHEAEIVRSAVELKNNYNIEKPIYKTNKDIDKNFWITKFVPAFSKAIKVDRSKRVAIKNVIANPF